MYILGNPPFVGYTYQSSEQKKDIQSIYIDSNGKTYKTAGKIDYVSCWYFKAAHYMQGTRSRAAFVSTNSITQGEQVAFVWQPIFERFNIHIDFCWRTFVWSSESRTKAAVHCVIIGFSANGTPKSATIYNEAGSSKEVANISPYLLDAPTQFITSRAKPLCDIPTMTKGSQPTDNGNLILDEEAYKDLISDDPLTKKYIRRYMGAREFLNNIPRWCIWLDGIAPALIKKCPKIVKRIEAVREFRLKSTKAATRVAADTPTIFQENRQPKSGTFIAVPEVSSGNRRYVPMGFLTSEIVLSNKLQIIANTNLYHFGILNSNVHNAWMRTVCGRLKSDYDYSNKVVYNNFPWPTPTDKDRASIEKTAQAILDARALYPDSSLADLYDPVTMPPELLKAHRANDKAVMQAYGFWGKLNSESECVAELMKMYEALTAEK